MLRRFLLILLLTFSLFVYVPADEPECTGDCQITESGVLIDGVKVVGAQQPGIEDAESTLPTVTTRLNLLLDALRRHGLIAGTATPPPAPAVMHKVSLFERSAQTIVNSEWKPVFFNSEFKDTDNMHTASVPSIIRINTAGDYDGVATVCFAANPTGARGIQFVITTSAGVSVIQGPQIPAVGGGKLTCIQSGMPIIPLLAGSTIEVRVFQDADKNEQLDLYPGKSSFSVGMR